MGKYTRHDDRPSLFRLAVTAMVLACAWQSQAQDAPCGSQLGNAAHKNVIARSNGTYMGTGESCAGRGTYGLQYQCVEYIKRFYGESFDLDSHLWRGNAIDYFSRAEVYGFATNINGETTVGPAPDDLIVFDSPSSVYGHVAVVTDVSGGSVSIIEQNWSRTGRAVLNLTLSNGLFRISPRGTYSILGWMRQSRFGWLTFIEGDPGLPGDGVFIDAVGGELPFAFEPTNPIPLSRFSDGFTIIVFLPPNAQALLNVSFSIVTKMPEPCYAHFGAGGGFPTGTISFNGTAGIYTNIKQMDIQGWLAAANSYEPNCNLTINDIFIGKIYLHTAILGETINTVDAISVLPGQGVFPGSGIPIASASAVH